MLGISIEGLDDVMVCPVVGDKGIIAWGRGSVNPQGPLCYYHQVKTLRLGFQ